ncbi:MAG: hypothetical protein ACO1RT_08185 [Planctomycetaceae bacterium]
MNLVPILNHRWLFAQLVCAVWMFGLGSRAEASCGDYLLSHHAPVDQVLDSGHRILLPWQMQIPCDQPGCRQSPPQSESLSTVAVEGRGPVTPVVRDASNWLFSAAPAAFGLPLSDESLPNGAPAGVFRPPSLRGAA